MAASPSLLARGPWAPEDVEARWLDAQYEAPKDKLAAADEAISALRDRGSPSHDGIAGRLVSHRVEDGRLILELQPARWALRLVEGDASDTMAALCVTRDAEGPWLSSWPGRWALGAGGAVDLGESPADTLRRELHEEWGVEAQRLRCDALVRLPQRLVMFVGTAWLPVGAELIRDAEHDAHAWWPADIGQWPDEADEPLRRMAALLA
jgi:8-oxo-dGTP diphosphatase